MSTLLVIALLHLAPPQSEPLQLAAQEVDGGSDPKPRDPQKKKKKKDRDEKSEEELFSTPEEVDLHG